ncbi:LysR family transcriptional regulator [Paenibacillus chitinolyticus]|uniref:LysR family transcriptional regulator n=1 Tax=Paenibacillus chitinolyticus TaxID=79263 RepID=UPI002DB67D8A|nr:LysR family transcriptional regulator [Paenibacillus chitinolyticus]MEC0247980.1 LysR family transcriptional regulator [Paenibacillus chitinolyticus]
MNLEQLEFIVEVARAGTLTQAAHNKHMTVAGISRSISFLEKELGVRIFNRSRTGAVPTPEGQMILGKAAVILSGVHQLQAEATSYGKLQNARLRVATIPGPVSLLVDTLTELKKDFPGIRLEMIEKGTKEIIEDVRHNRVDIGFILFPDTILEKNACLHAEPLVEGRMVVGVSRHSALASAKSLSLNQLADHQLVLYHDEYIARFIATLGDSVNVLFTSNNIDAIMKAVREGIAVTLGTDYTFYGNPDYENGDIVMVNAELPGERPSYLWCVHPKEQPYSQAAHLFVNRLKMQLKRRR